MDRERAWLSDDSCAVALTARIRETSDPSHLTPKMPVVSEGKGFHGSWEPNEGP